MVIPEDQQQWEKEAINLENAEDWTVRTDSAKIPPRVRQVDEKKVNYWKWTIFAVLVPFLIIGVPIHLFFANLARPPKNLSPGKAKDKKMSTGSWFRLVFNPCGQHPLIIVLTIITFAIGGSLLGYVTYAILKILYHIIILGIMGPDLAIGFLDLVRTVPATIPVLYGWLKGYEIAEFISSLDTTRQELKDEIGMIEHAGEILDSLPKATYGKKRGTRRALTTLYFAIVTAHAVHVAAERVRSDTGVWVTHFIDFMHNLVIPLYAALCWVVSSEFEILARNLEVLQISGCPPTFEVFVKIKICFKKISNHVHVVNDTMKGFICWVMIVTLVSALAKIIFASVYIFGIAALKVILFSGASIFGFLGKIGKAAVDSATGKVDEAPPQPAPGVVRSAMAYYFAAGVQIFLIFYMMGQARKLNNQARYVHVLLNDYASQVADQMTPEVYHGFRLLKFYMHSVNEQFRSALLKLPILGVFPPMKESFQGYKLRS